MGNAEYMGLPKQVDYVGKNEQANCYQPQGRSIPSPKSCCCRQANDPRYAPQQDRTRSTSFRSIERLRRMSSTIQPPTKVQDPSCLESHSIQTWTKSCFSRISLSRTRMAIRWCCLQIGSCGKPSP